MTQTALKKTTKLRRLITSCLLLVVLLITLYVTIARQMVVWVAEYKVELQNNISEILHTPVSIGGLNGSWDIFSPTLTVHDIHIGGQEQTLEVDQLTLEIDIPKTILSWQVRIAKIHGENLKLQIRENEPDIWSIGGIPRQKTPITPKIILSQLQRFKQISISNSTISIHPYKQPSKVFTHINASLTHYTDEDMRLDGILYINDDKPIILSANASINPKHWHKLKGTFYADIPYIDWQTWLPKDLQLPWKLKNLIFGGQVWGAIKNGQLQSVTIDTKNSQLVVSYKQNETIAFNNISMTSWFNRDKQQYMDLQIANLSFDANKTKFNNRILHLTQRLKNNEEQWDLQASTLNIENIIVPVLALAPIPQTIQQIIHNVNPKGIINDLQITWLPNKPITESINFSANIKDISFNPYNETVGASNITGNILGGINKGTLSLDAKDFSLYIAKLYNKPWHYKQANTNLNWSFDGEKVSIFSHLMKLKGDEGDLIGDMMIRLYPKDAIKDYMDLRVNICNGNASYAPKYIPSKAKIDPVLVHWLNTAIISGDIKTGFFQYQGSLDKRTPSTAHALLLYLKAVNTEVNYQHPWLPIRDIEGEVFMEPSGVRIIASKGTISNSQVNNITINIPHVDNPAITHLHLKTNITSTVNDTLHILKKAPHEISDVFKDWQGKGNIEGKLQLDIPLKKNHRPLVIADFTTQDAQLDLQYPVPLLNNIAGVFHYDSRYGLSSESITANTLGNQIYGSIEAKGKSDPLSYLKLKGTINIAKLADWYLMPRKDWPVSGKTPYDLELWIGKNNQLKLSSNFKGVSFDLPAPFNKTAEQTKAFSYQMSFGKQQKTQLQFDYGSLISAAITMNQDKQNWQGELLVNQGKASFSGKQGLQIQANLSQLNLAAWYGLYNQYLTNLPKNKSSAAFNNNEIHSINLLIGKVQGFNIPPQQVAIYIQPTGKFGWRLNIDSPSLFGRITAPQTKDLPYYIHLNYLKVPDNLTTLLKEKKSNENFNIDSIPDVNLSIQQLFLGNDLIGSVRFNNARHEKGLKISNIALNIKGVHLRGDLDWQIGNNTTFNGRLFGKNLEKVFTDWNIKPGITAESFKVSINGTWKGSPTDFAPDHFTGTLAPELKYGRILRFDDSSANILRIFGILNLEAVTKQLRLDFTDFYKPGLAFDSIKGELKGNDGVLHITKPLVLEGPSMMISMTGQVNMQTQQIDADLKVGIPLASSISIATLAVTPPIGGAMLIADYFLGNELMKIAAIHYKIKGSWSNPTVTR